MCGRFGLSYPRSRLMDWYRARAMPEYEFRYNIPPTTDIVAIRDGEEGRNGSLMRWGLIAWWAKDGKKAPLLHNARAETITAKPIFTSSFYRRRCIIPATGFFEWERLPDGRKQPFYISSRDGNPLSFAGIWDAARVDGIRVDSCAIITTDCNALMQPIHDRMPVILREDDWDTWLNPGIASDKVLLSMPEAICAGPDAAVGGSACRGKCYESGGGINPAGVIVGFDKIAEFLHAYSESSQDETPNGRLFFGIFAALAEFERELIAERTRAGLAAARSRGRKGGRPRKMDRATLMMAMTAMSDAKANAGDIAKRLNITTTTLYAYVNGDGSLKASGQTILGPV